MILIIDEVGLVSLNKKGKACSLLLVAYLLTLTLVTSLCTHGGFSQPLPERDSTDVTEILILSQFKGSHRNPTADRLPPRTLLPFFCVEHRHSSLQAQQRYCSAKFS